MKNSIHGNIPDQFIASESIDNVVYNATKVKRYIALGLQNFVNSQLFTYEHGYKEQQFPRGSPFCLDFQHQKLHFDLLNFNKIYNNYILYKKSSLQ